jgi:hypothetical protein
MAYTNQYEEYDTETLIEQLGDLTQAIRINLEGVSRGERAQALGNHLRILDDEKLDTIIYLGRAAESLRQRGGY